MTRREIAVAVAVLAVLATLAGWQRRPREAPPIGPQPVFSEEQQPPGPITAVELSQEGPAGVHGRLQLREHGWVLTTRDDAPVDLARVQRLLDALDGLVGEVRADDPALLPEFQLSGEGVIRIESHSGGPEPRVLLVGKRGPRSNRSFVRPEGDDRAWLAHAPLHSALGIHGRGDRPLDPSFYVDLHLFRIEADEVLAVAVEGEQTWTVVRDGAGAEWRWALPATGESPDERSATGKAHSVARLRASALVGAAREAAYGLDDPIARIGVKGADGDTRMLLVGAAVPPDPPEGDETPRDPEERFVQVEGEVWIWRLRTASLDAISRRPE